MRCALVVGCSALALAVAPFAAARAQDSNTPPQQAPQPAPETQGEQEDPRIVVIGQRVIIASLEDVEPEQVYDEDRVLGYDVSTVGELLEEIRGENGDQDPSVLVNGQPVDNLGDVADLPVEAIESIEALPRGSAQRVGGGAGQRAYNIVLKPAVKSATLTGSYEFATEGGWSNLRGEALFTYIDGQDRVNLTLRGADSDVLFESERTDFIPRTTTTPYSPLGNIIPNTGTEVDPTLSALLGRPVTVVALQAGTPNPTLASLLPGANVINPAEDGRFRSLRGSSQPFELAVSGNKTLTPWLALAFNSRINWTESESFRGLPSARFVIPTTNPFTPFSNSVSLALNDPSRPLKSTNDITNGSFSATLNANFGLWHASLTGRYDERESTFLSQFVSASTITVDPAANPFAGSLASSIPVSSRVSYSKTDTTQFSADAEGPVVDLWAGPLLARVGLGAAWVNLDSTVSTGTSTEFERHEYTAKAGITIPLTSQDPAFLPALGDSELALDIGTIDLGQYGSVDRYSIALNWQLAKWLNIVASEVKDEHAISPELFAAPSVITPNVPYFDPLTGQTVDVTTIYGGAGALTNDKLRTRTLALTASPLPKYNVQLDARYEVTDLRNQIGALPPPSTAVVAAFPDRFLRDPAGTLILVDNRSVNFERQHNERLRFGLGFTVPIQEAVTIPANRETGTPTRRIPATRLQVNASHSMLLDSTTRIRAGLPEIDLRAGGAIGIGGGGQRYLSDLTLALTRGGTGARLSARRFGKSLLITGTPASPNLLTFEPVTTVDLKVFADLGQLFPTTRAAKGTRVTVALDNLFNERQRVVDTVGVTPQAYQPIYRDAVGRTVLFELRKVF